MIFLASLYSAAASAFGGVTAFDKKKQDDRKLKEAREKAIGAQPPK